MGPLPFSGVLFGAAYYAEYQPTGSVERDLDPMKAAGFSVIRVGESVWSTWEPREGVFALDWLQPVLDAAHARGIGVVLGTPTYAVPPWLQRLHPEIAAEVATGQRIAWGARQEMDQSHPAYRFYAERIARKVVARYADHPAVIGYQVDNEPGLQLPHNDHTFQRFVAWLRERYGDVDSLNDAWGLVYWSHRLSDWAELWRPDGTSCRSTSWSGVASSPPWPPSWSPGRPTSSARTPGTTSSSPPASPTPGPRSPTTSWCARSTSWRATRTTACRTV